MYWVDGGLGEAREEAEREREVRKAEESLRKEKARRHEEQREDEELWRQEDLRREREIQERLSREKEETNARLRPEKHDRPSSDGEKTDPESKQKKPNEEEDEQAMALRISNKERAAEGLPPCSLGAFKENQAILEEMNLAKEEAAKAASELSKFNPPSTTLSVGNFTDSITESQLRHQFVWLGNASIVHLPKDDNGAHKGYAYVSYESVDKATKDLKAMNGVELDGRKIRIDYAKLEKQTSKTPSKLLRIRFVSEACTEEDLHWAFEEYGTKPKTIMDCYIPKIEKGMKKGIAFAAFSTVEEAAKAKNEMDGLEVKGKKIRVQFVREAGKGKAEKRVNTPVEEGEKVETQPKKTNPDESNQGVNRTNNPPFKELIIRNVSQRCTKDDLRQAFKPLRSINHYIHLNGKRENTDFGSVSFKTVQEAVEAKRKLDGTKVGGSIIYSDFDEEYREGKGGKRARSPAGQEETEEPPSKKQMLNDQDAPRVKTAPSSKLCIDNIPEECTDEDLLEHFEDDNWKVTGCVIPKDKKGVNKGIGFVSFAAIDEAVAAKRARDGTEVFREKIRIDFIAEAEEGKGSAEMRKLPPVRQKETNEHPPDKQRLNGEGETRVKTAPSSKLRIENIHGVCTDDDVIGWILVDHNSDVPDCLFEKDGNGIHHGIAFVTFSSVEQAVAIQNKLDGTEVFGQEIRVDFVAETKWGTAEQHKHTCRTTLE